MFQATNDIASHPALPSVLQDFARFVARQQFDKDRRAYDRAVSSCVAEVFGETLVRRCRECDKPFDRIPRVSTALFCVACITKFDGGTL